MLKRSCSVRLHRRPAVWCGLFIIMLDLLAVIAVPPALGQIIPPGRDCFETDYGSTWVQIGLSGSLPPIPADFFFPGSMPWAGRIDLRGRPLPGAVGSVNTMVHRLDLADLSMGPANITIRLEELDMVGVAPVTVYDEGGNGYLYNVEITLNPNAGYESMGRMVIFPGDLSGGWFTLDVDYESGLWLWSRWQWTEVTPYWGDPPPWDAPLPELLEIPEARWQYAQPPLVCEPGNNFYPVPGLLLRFQLDGGESGGHGVYPPREVMGCCFPPDGRCENLPGEDCVAMGGTPQLELCAGRLEGCCIPDPQGFGMICVDVDPVCCDDLGGTPQGAGTACVDMTIACCVPVGPTIVCVEVDPLCCDELGGTPGYLPHCVGDLNGNGIDDACDEPPALEPKWHQPSHGGGQGFDAASDLWWFEPSSKWEQMPDLDLPGLHAHDSAIGPLYQRVILADDWRCAGGDITDIHWWGNYELDTTGQERRGSGIAYFHVSIHLCGGGVPWCLPMEPEILGFDLPWTPALEQATGMVNVEGCRVYRYDFFLPLPVPQQSGMYYWLDITAVSNDPVNPPMWRWQEANRDFMFLGHAPAAEKTEPPIPGVWQSIVWPTDQFSDLAFRITSSGPVPPIDVNRVVADDFISDGRPILALDWFGSYLDPLYEPTHDPVPPYILDGWFISFHHTPTVSPTVPGCPPDFVTGDNPTVLGVYFAPVDAVTISGLFMADCLGHGVYLYDVNLNRCCLLCSNPDPRLPLSMPPPAQPGRFNESSGLRYWLDIQAVVGVTWNPRLGCTYADRIPTGHLPSPNSADGHFWGWHTSPADFMPQGWLREACAGRIVDFSPYPPDCWQYGEWVHQQWLCDTMPPFPPVNMAFTLLAPVCDPAGDVNYDGVLDINDIQCFVQCLLHDVVLGCVCGCADMDHNYVVNGLDIQLFVDALLGP